MCSTCVDACARALFVVLVILKVINKLSAYLNPCGVRTYNKKNPSDYECTIPQITSVHPSDYECTD